MAIYIDEMKELQLYNRQFFVPIQKENKHKGSCVFLLTPDYNTSKLLMTNPNMINLNMFRSYYMERDVALIISPDGKIEESAVINEEKFGMSENLSQDAYQFLMGLYMKFQKYSERDDANPKKDRLSLRTCILRLSDNKYDKLMDEIGTVIEKYQMMNEGGKERNLSIISAPVDV